MSDYLISIILPTFNAEKYLNRCIDSIINQTLDFNKIELIIIDDNSTDSTKNILKEYSAKYPNIILVFNETNSGSPSKPRNIGLEIATSDYIMFIDNDDLFKKDMCATMYNTIIKEDVDIVTCRPVLKLNNKENMKNKTFLDKEKEFVKFDSVKDYPKIMSSGVTTLIWNKIFKRKLLINSNIRFPDEYLYEDVYFMIQAYLNAEGVVMLNNYWGYEYIIRTEGKSKSTSQNHNEKNLIKQLKGLKKIVELLQQSNANYPALECEMLIGWTKIFILTPLNDEKRRKILAEAGPLYKSYHWNSKLVNVSLPLNILINIFMKVFSFNTSTAIIITKITNAFRKV